MFPDSPAPLTLGKSIQISIFAALLLLFFFGSIAQASPPAVVDASTLTGKIMCGYQGWFGAPGDGSKLKRWIHWGTNAMSPGTATVDLWPDMSELDPDEQFFTGFHFLGGRVATVFSSFSSKTVMRHFQWMREYGIDGIFLQRFATGLGNDAVMDHYDHVLASVRAGANANGRVFGLMYDLSGLRDSDVGRVIADWKHLTDDLGMTRDPRYIHHHGKPVVALWGIGFADRKDPLLAGGGLRLVHFLSTDQTYGNNCVMLGVPTNWRIGGGDSADSAGLLAVINAADIISPWTVGRYSNLNQIKSHAANRWAPDQQWCSAHGKEYMPVVFPGFSWHNLRHGKSPLNQIPRLGGRFLWAQYAAAKQSGATMVYQAMFDEVDEGTAIFKCANDVPDGEGKSEFLTYEGLPSDFYLKLVGEASQLIRGEITADDEKLIGASSR